MPQYVFWYKKEVLAPSLGKALALEKKQPFRLDSVQEKEEQKHNTHLIGFHIQDEECYEE